MNRQKFWTMLGQFLVGEHYGQCIICGKKCEEQYVIVAGEGRYCFECAKMREQQTEEREE